MQFNGWLVMFWQSLSPTLTAEDRLIPIEYYKPSEANQSMDLSARII
jgi:hypothetical protein